MNIAFFGSSLVSAYWNGAVTYYRGLLRALHARGHRIVFYEPDAFSRQQHRDIADPDWATVVVYVGDQGARECLERALSADLVVKASGVGVFDELLERCVLQQRRPGQAVVFWDVDAPATLERIESNAADPFLQLIPQYDLVFTYGGGEPVIQRYRKHGARSCVPIYNAVDPDTHAPADPDPRFTADLGFLGNRLPDREARADRFFFDVARAMPDLSFVLGGNGWHDKPMPMNVRYVGHVYTHEHNAFNASVSATLNVSRDSMASTGFSPATRVFEAAGAGACILTDAWEGIEHFFEPEREILVARDTNDVVQQLRALTPELRRQIGAAARQRVLAQHTYALRALEVERTLAAMQLDLAS
jgi:spore maturation protein CgeB